MKREGRQHGMVRTYRILPSPWNPRPEQRVINRLDSPPTAGLFTKVAMKPTNHSKPTGRCGRPRCQECHMHPACKSKDKTKGIQKLRSSHDMVTNYRLITWRVADGKPGLNFSGFSATRILDDLSNDYEDYDDHEYSYEDEDDQCGVLNDGIQVDSQSPQEIENYEGEINEEQIVDHDDDNSEGVYVIDHDDMRFVLDQEFAEEEEEEGWCLVEGI